MITYTRSYNWRERCAQNFVIMRQNRCQKTPRGQVDGENQIILCVPKVKNKSFHEVNKSEVIFLKGPFGKRKLPWKLVESPRFYLMCCLVLGN